MPEAGPKPRTTLFLESRYRKLVRGLPQTVLFCPACKGHRRRRQQCALCEGRGRLAGDSVQEIVARAVLPACRARRGVFHGAGREDVDVRMLGRGRPFVFEVVGARSAPDLEGLRASVHRHAAGRIEIDPFRMSSRGRIAWWKEAAFEKTYRARARLAGPPAVDPAGLAGRHLAVEQRTPQRVAHRRADLTRARSVEILAVEPLAPDALDLVLRCAHGTYVKEWISGDEGRTRPALADLLGVPAACTELDVLDLGDGEAAPAADRMPLVQGGG